MDKNEKVGELQTLIAKEEADLAFWTKANDTVRMEKIESSLKLLKGTLAGIQEGGSVIGEAKTTKEVNKQIRLASGYQVDTHGMGECWAWFDKIVDSPVKKILLYGPPGTSKTTAADSMAADRNVLFSQTLTEESGYIDIWGCWTPNEKGEPVWRSAPGKLAWESGGHLILNEINDMEDVSPVMCLLDDFNIARNTLPNGETLTPSAGFRCVATMNGTPFDGGLREALLDRFEVKINVDLPSPGALEVFPIKVQEVVVNNYQDPENMKFTYREMVAFWMLRDSVGIDIASKAVWGTGAVGKCSGADIVDDLKIAGVEEVMNG